MRIAFLSTFYPYRGGIAQFNASLLREFEKEHDIKAFTFTRQYPGILFPGKTQMVTPDDKVTEINSERVLDTINPFSYYSAAKKILAYKPEILLMKFWMSYFAPSLGKASSILKNKGVKTISILDNVISHEKKPGETALVKYFLNSNSGFIVMTEKVKDDLLKLKPDAKYSVVSHPLYDHFGAGLPKQEARSKLNIPADKKVLLFFGFIRDYKGLDLLIEAVNLLDDSYILLIAGEVYGSFDKYQSQINSLGLQEKIKLFVQYIPDTDVTLYFSASDVCVLPYRSATQSGIVGIAYHFGLPVIATNVGGLSEIIQSGNTGLITDEISPEGIAASVNKFFVNKFDYSSAISVFKLRHSWKNFAAEIIEFSKHI